MKVVKLNQKDIIQIVENTINDAKNAVKEQEDQQTSIVMHDASEVKNNPDGVIFTMGEDENFIYIFAQPHGQKARLVTKRQKN